MKRLLIMIVAIGTILAPLSARCVGSGEAKNLAINYMLKHFGLQKHITDSQLEWLEDELCFYIFNFEEGGWAIVSAESRTIPILAYGLSGEVKMDADLPPAMIDLLDTYKLEIVDSRKNQEEYDDERWTLWKREDTVYKASVGDNVIISKTPSQQNFIVDCLLDNTGRGELKWGQSKNNSNSNSCTPSYNSACPSTDNDNCDCGHKSVGCGAVAMGQIMWYWQWPPSSQYRNYHWQMMPNELTSSSTTEQGDNVAALLRDCGRNGMDYTFCKGSFITTNKIEETLNDIFHYESAVKYVKHDYPLAFWKALLKSELDAGRPVLYRGDKSDLSLDKHYFVLDGYDSDDAFHINWGWGVSLNEYFQIGDITSSTYNIDYHANNQAILGISPTYPSSNTDIQDLFFSLVDGGKAKIEASGSISIPPSNETLIVSHGGDMSVKSGSTIQLMPGFEVSYGGTLSAEITSAGQSEMSLGVTYFPSTFNMNTSALTVTVKNVNSYEFTVTTLSGTIVYRGAGYISGTTAVVWDGSGASPSQSYLCSIRIKNNYGRRLDYSTVVMVTASGNNVSSAQAEITSMDEVDHKPKWSIYPNPVTTSSVHMVNSNFSMPSILKVFDMQGKLMLERRLIDSDTEIDLSDCPVGIYLFLTESADGHSSNYVLKQ